MSYGKPDGDKVMVPAAITMIPAVIIGHAIRIYINNLIQPNILLSVLIQVGATLALFFSFRLFFRFIYKNDPYGEEAMVLLLVVIGLPFTLGLDQSGSSLLLLLIPAGVIVLLFFPFRSYLRRSRKNDG